ncbi:uncharacterized protein LDX57_010618 [Aspergillus melleus]|uniref:uncharacterized protein n=1 Tax=Aspergillus melleus TaxID=138277 RepID=UPI001E8CFC22|nr:uncharacterized protein LDX57_010618 [Aspergillus melleus]KAH8432983.1 hypothetical protein LDX57_010618 [Aspergillus melleus]
MEELPANDGHNEDGNANVGSEEVSRVPISFQKYWEAGDQGDNSRSDEPEPGSIRLQRGHPGQRAAADALRLESGVKPDVTEAERRPGDQTGDGAQIQQPGERLRGATRAET